MNAIIVSDLHIGSQHFLHEDFECFLKNVSEDHELILNGDIIDNPYENLKPPHQRILDLIKQKSYRQKVVWVRGNHDNGYVPKGFEKVHFTRFYNLGHRLLIAHGDDFDEIMPRNQAFIQAFKLMHDLRVKLGARPVHVAQYAKKWEIFYKFLRKIDMKRSPVAILTTLRIYFPMVLGTLTQVLGPNFQYFTFK